jgi:hypothetical protein
MFFLFPRHTRIIAVSDQPYYKTPMPIVQCLTNHQQPEVARCVLLCKLFLVSFYFYVSCHIKNKTYTIKNKTYTTLLKYKVQMNVTIYETSRPVMPPSTYTTNKTYPALFIGHGQHRSSCRQRINRLS